MSYYPLYTDLSGRTCLLVGVGKMIEEKSESLKDSGAVIRRRSSFSEEDARGVFLIVADVEEETAERIQAFGERNQVFVNIVDKPKYCSFIVPAVVQQENLLIAISTSGKSPVLAGWIRERLQQEYGPQFGCLLDVFGKTRKTVKETLPRYSDRKAFYRRLLDGGILQTAGRGREAVEQQLVTSLQKFKKRLQH